MILHLLRYQGLVVDDYGFAIDASNMGHPRLSLIRLKARHGSITKSLSGFIFTINLTAEDYKWQKT
jgi:hypothetical protein